MKLPVHTISAHLPCLLAAILGACVEAPPPREASVTSQLASCAPFEGSPFCQSPVITGISWSCAAGQLAPGSDIWTMTWAADDTVIGSWGDGSGFGGDNAATKVSTGFGQLAGTPPSFTSTINLWGGNSARAAATFGGKPGALVSANATLFATMGIRGVTDFGPDSAPPQLVWSSNASHTDWQHETAWSYTDASPPGSFGCCSFINFGKDNAGAPGFPTYVYAYGKSGAKTILIRVPVASIHTKTAYQFFTGTDAGGNPQWGALASAVSVFDDPTLVGSVSANFDPGINRFLLVGVHGTGSSLEQSIYDAPNMWGPWTTVQYTDHWCTSHFGGEDEGLRLTAKWMLDGGKTLWAGYSSAGSDQLNLVTATLSLNNPPPPSTLGVSQLSGLSPDSGDDNTMSGLQVTTGSLALPVTSLSVFIATAIDAAPHNLLQVAIYTDSAGKPGTRVVSSGSQAAVEGWNTVPLTTTLAASTKYWLLYNTNATSHELNEIDNGAMTGFTSFFTAQAFGTWPTTVSGGTAWGGATAMYVTYSAGTSGTVGVSSPAGLSPDSGDNNTISGMQVTIGSQAVHASSLSVFVGSAIDAAPHDLFQVAIYTDAGGRPGAPVATSASHTVVPGWNTVALSANLSAGTRYWLLYNTNATTPDLNEIDNNARTGFTSFFAAQPFGTWPSSVAGGTTWGGAAAMVLNFP